MFPFSKTHDFMQDFIQWPPTWYHGNGFYLFIIIATRTQIVIYNFLNAYYIFEFQTHPILLKNPYITTTRL
jgi:hypothetical protein